MYMRGCATLTQVNGVISYVTAIVATSSWEQ